MNKVCSIILSLFFFICPVFAEEFNISSENVILYNLKDDSVLYSKNADEVLEIASLTKIMTALVIIDSVDNLAQQITITTQDFEGTAGYSKAGFKVGNIVSYEDLLYGIILPSGADAVNAAVNNTLGYDAFVAKMNEIAKTIGMKNTNFSNPIGKDENNYSTAEDVAKLLKYALKNDSFKKIFTTKSYTASNGLVLNSTLNSYSDILDTSIIDGAKSGFTQKAGRCLASIASLNGTDALLIVLKADTNAPYNAVKDSIDIYTYFNENYSNQTIINDNTFLKEIPISLSSDKSYKITGGEDIELYLKNNTKVDLVYEGIDKITYKTKKGTKLGVVKIYEGSNLLTTSDVFLEEDISYYHLEIFGVVFFLMVLILIPKRKKKRRRRKK